MENKVVNKQIPIKTIIDLADYFEDYKKRYDVIFEKEREKNKGLSYSERNFEYEDGFVSLKYTIVLHNGKDLTEEDYDWFIKMLNNPREIKIIYITFRVSYYTKEEKDSYNSKHNSFVADISFKDYTNDVSYSDVNISIQSNNQEKEANNIYSTVMNILENNENRYNKTIRKRKFRIQSFCISIGIVLSYILFIVLKINAGNISSQMVQFLNNKFFVLIGQWVVAILFGNLFSYWYIISIYKPLLPSTKFAGFNSTRYEAQYKDNIEEYVSHSEVHFGKYWDAENRRNKIEKIYKITSKIVLIQLLISAILFFVLK